MSRHRATRQPERGGARHTAARPPVSAPIPTAQRAFCLTRHTLPALQRSAGNQALTGLLNRAGQPPRGPARPVPVPVPVQRNVGFEFELDAAVTTYQRNPLGRYRPLTKRERILSDADYYVEADGLPGGRSSWEFVTTAFPETQPGLVRLMQVLDRIDGVVGLLRASPRSTQAGGTIHNPVGPGFAAFGAPVPNRYFVLANTVIRTKPQITAGFALTALNELFRSATSAPGAGISNLARDTASMDNTGKLSAGPAIDVALGAMWAAADNAVTAALGHPDAALQALVTQLVQVIVGGQQNIGATPKTVLRLALHRSDMKAAFDQLPAPVRGPLQAAPATFVTLVMNAVNAVAAVANNAPVISGNLFADNQYANDRRHNTPSPFQRVSCDQWLTAIATPGGSDLLSPGRYPVRTYVFGMVGNRTDRKANRLLGSMGGLHAALDPGNRPVYEIRSSKEIHTGLIPAYALDFFKYVRYLHNPGALTESAELTGMAVNDIIEFVGFTPNRPALVNAMQTRAMNTFNT